MSDKSDKSNNPAPEDLARDLRADLETCEGTREGVSPGPWAESRIATHDMEGDFCGHDLYVLDARREEIGGMEGYDDNAFVVASRTGWPAAIRRAMTAEAEVARLRKALEQVHAAVRHQSSGVAGRVYGITSAALRGEEA